MKQHPLPVINTEPLAEPLELPQIETAVIDMQDVEHKPGSDTRVSNKGMRIEPRIDSTGQRDLANEDEDVLEALEEIEKRIHGQLPG